MLLDYLLLAYAFLCLFFPQSLYFCLACHPPRTKLHVYVGETTYVCVHFAPISWQANGSYYTIPSTMKADEFSSLNIKESWTSVDYANDKILSRFRVSSSLIGSGMAVSVSSMGVISKQRAYRVIQPVANGTIITAIPATNISNGSMATEINYVPRAVTFPLLLAIINVDSGIVKSVDWDDDCLWCSPSQCACNEYLFSGAPATPCGQSCWINDGECAVPSDLFVAANTTTNALCQLNVYVVWAGTDRNGLNFRSSALRFSQFSSMQISAFVSDRKRHFVTNLV